MADVPAPSVDEHLWTIAVARLIFAPAMNIQAPPNLSPARSAQLIAAGINDWGGVSPVTPDHVNPEAPWPHCGARSARPKPPARSCVERLAIYPGYARDIERWVDPGCARRAAARQSTPMAGRAPTIGRRARRAASAAKRCDWRRRAPRAQRLVANHRSAPQRGGDACRRRDRRACSGRAATISPRSARRRRVAARDQRRHRTYVVTRNINYTNICYFKCQFCAFSKGKLSENLRGRPYDLSLERSRGARGKPGRAAPPKCACKAASIRIYTGRDLSRDLPRGEAAPCRACTSTPSRRSKCTRARRPRSAGRGVSRAAERGRARHIAGTAAEVLDDEVRAVLCPDKIDTARWLEVMRAAHRIGLQDGDDHVRPRRCYEHWARHLLRLRDLQAETGGFTEFVPLPFVHMEAPIYLKGRARDAARLSAKPC